MRKQASKSSAARQHAEPTAFFSASAEKAGPFFNRHVPTPFFSAPASLQKQEQVPGLPAPLKSGMEALSGYAMDEVKVHYQSSKPTALQAHAFAQGQDIYVAPGQEQHLPHEAWHVVQQKQGRVKPTLHLQGQAINHQAALEKEADRMGEQAQRTSRGSRQAALRSPQPTGPVVVQRLLKGLMKGKVAGGLVEKSRPADLVDETPAIIWKNMQPETQAKAHSTLWFQYELNGQPVLGKLDWVEGGFRMIHQAAADAYYKAPEGQIQTTVGAIIAKAKAHISEKGNQVNTLQGHCHAFAADVYDRLSQEG